jgi:beta-glucosidase-like glycosyl hydrolase
MSDELDRDAAGALIVGLPGTTATDELRRAVAGGLGGVILFTRNVADAGQVAALTASLRAERSSRSTTRAASSATSPRRTGGRSRRRAYSAISTTST